MKKKILSVILTLCMVVGLLPAVSITAGAVGTTVTNETELRAAVEDKPDFDVTLGADITLTSALNITTSGTINGGGYTLSASVTGTDEQGITNSDASNYYLLNIASSPVTISNMTIKGGAKSAVFLNYYNANLTMQSVIITQSGSSTNAGGGLYIYSASKVVLKDCALTRNVADFGGGFCNRGTLVMDGCSVTENRNIGGTMRGGGGCENGGTLYLNNCTFANNQSTEIGGAINNRGTLYVMNSDITGNVSTNGSSANDGGGIGNNGDSVTIVNSVLANNYATSTGGTYVASDFGAYNSDGNVSVINSICGAYVTGEDGTTGFPTTNTDSTINASGNSQTGIFVKYITSPLLNADGTKVPGISFSRPVLLKQSNNTYAAPLASSSAAGTGGTNTYFDYSDFSSIIIDYDDFSSIIIAFGAAPTYVLGSSGADVENAITTYQGGSTRDAGVIGAFGTSATNYYTVCVQPSANGTVTGGTVFGDVYEDGTPVTLTAVPDSGYSLSKWQKWNGSAWEDISGATASTYTFNVTADVNIRAIFLGNVSVTLQKDGAVWADSGYTLKLCKFKGLTTELLTEIDMTDTGTGIYTAVVGTNDQFTICDGATNAIGRVSVGTTGSQTLDYYSVSYIGNHVSFSSEPTVILGAGGLTLSLLPDLGYKLPTSISVTMDGYSNMTPTWDGVGDFMHGTYYYNKDTGGFKMLVVKGKIEISATASGGSGVGTAATGGAPVIVNKETYTAGTSKDTMEDGKTVTQVTVDTGKLQTILDTKGQNASVVIPVTNGSAVASGVLTGQMVKNMETKEATLEIQTNSATYTLPASEINIDDVSKQLGKSVALSDIQVKVQIAEPSDTTVKVVNNAAASNSFSLMVPAVDFSISCTNNGKTVAVSSFNAYVERTIAIPDGVDPTKITTGVVVEADGTTRHVPTQVTIIDGKYYATINSLTNSTYAVIWHPIEFTDVTDHWANDAINDMGSRMVVNGVGDNNYEPDRDITRAEFAAIVVRALGLAPGTGESSFGDVAASDWYCGYIETASSYGIVNGYNKATFGPNDKITREQAMAMIARAMKITRLDTTLTDSEMVTLLASYTDSADASDYAKTSIAACLKTGVVTGRSSSTVAPKENITRAEVAVIVQRLLKNSKLI